MPLNVESQHAMRVMANKLIERSNEIVQQTSDKNNADAVLLASAGVLMRNASGLLR